MRQTVWITRTQPSAHDSAKAFELAGYKTVVAPLLTVKPKAISDAVPEGAVLIFTSQNGVRAFCESETRRDFAVMAVGDATASLARSLGFNDVRSAGGTSNDIAPLIAKSVDRSAHYIHISGQHVRGSVSEDLRAMGLKAERRIYYSSTPCATMPDIDVSQIDYVTLFSPLAAKIFAQIAPNVSHIEAVSISSATDAALGALQLRTRRIARVPTLDSLIAALDGTG